MASFERFFSTFSLDDQERGRQFEEFGVWLLRQAPRYRDQLRNVWLWKDWPDHRRGDAGIDIVAEHKDGSLWAVQCKAYDPKYTISKKDVDSFLAKSATRKFAFRLLIASTDKLNTHVQDQLRELVVPVGLLLRTELEEELPSWPERFEDITRNGSDISPPTPFPHQEDAVAACVAGFGNSERGQLLMACGTGKTNVGLWVSEKLEAKRTLVLVPTLSLLKQTIRQWTRNRTVPFEYLAVCSDDSVEDSTITSASDLGVRTTTSPQLVAAFLRSATPQVIFATYKSSPAIAEGQARRQVPRFDLVIADEAHRCAGPNEGIYSTVLDAKKIRADRRLFMTATPRYFSPRLRAAAAEAEFEVASMDDESRFGTVFHRLAFSKAISLGLLSDYRVAVMGVDSPEVEGLIADAAYVALGNEETDAQALGAHIGLAKAVREFDLRSTLTFHSRVKAARAFSEHFPRIAKTLPAEEQPDGDIWASYVEGRMTAGEREARLRAMRATDPGVRRFLSNAKCLSEGVDIPGLDGVVFVDPRGSQVDIVQAVGRAIRRRPDGVARTGTVVLPVFIPVGTPDEHALDNSAFWHIWAVLRALRAHDDVLAERLDELRRGRGLTGARQSVPDKIVLRVPLRVGQEFAEALKARILEETSASWEEYYGVLQRFVQEHGYACVPVQLEFLGYRLGAWVSEQRKLYGRRLLAPDRLIRLESLPNWVWDKFEADFQEGYLALKTYVERTRTAAVPQKAVEDGFPIGRWVSELRKRQKRGTLEQQRVALLEALPGWTWDRMSHAWDMMFELLAAYAANNNHCSVPQGYRVAGKNLGAWVNNQRNARKRGALTQQKIDRLESLPGWTWTPKDDLWDRALAHLQGFVDEHGHARVPVRFVTDSGYPLGQWVGSVRSKRAAGRFPEEKVRRLEAFPDWVWSTYDANREDAKAALLRYVGQHGTSMVPAGVVFDGINLGDWVARQRGAKKRGKLSADEIHWLDRLPLWDWNPPTIPIRRRA